MGSASEIARNDSGGACGCGGNNVHLFAQKCVIDGIVDSRVSKIIDITFCKRQKVDDGSVLVSDPCVCDGCVDVGNSKNSDSVSQISLGDGG